MKLARCSNCEIYYKTHRTNPSKNICSDRCDVQLIKKLIKKNKVPCSDCNKYCARNSKRCRPCLKIFYKKNGHPLKKPNGGISRSKLYTCWQRIINSTSKYDPRWKSFAIFSSEVPQLNPNIKEKMYLKKIQRNVEYTQKNVEWIVEIPLKKYELLLKDLKANGFAL